MRALKTANKHELDVNLLDPIKISTLPKPERKKNPRTGRAASSVKMGAFVYDKTYTAHRSCDNYWRPIDIDKEYGEGIYVVIEGHKSEIYSGKLKMLNQYKINAIRSFLGEDPTIYGVRTRDLESLGDGWERLCDAVDEKFNSDYAQLGWEEIISTICADDYANTLENSNSSLYYAAEKHKDALYGMNNSFTLYFQESAKIKENVGKCRANHKILQCIKDVVNIPNVDEEALRKAQEEKFNKLKEAVDSDYPLLQYIEEGKPTNYSHGRVPWSKILDYIKTCDASRGSEE